jgi:glycine cleavage system H protein
MQEPITYMSYHWILIDGDELTVGVNDECLQEFTDIESVDLPPDGTQVHPDEVCGELDTDAGPVNIYCPVDGTVIELNEAVVNNPKLIIEDPHGDGWLFRVQAESIGDLESPSWEGDE